jgi:hypothetical protein
MASYAYTFTSGDTVTPTKLNNARTISNIVNADISNSAAIAGSKLADGAINNAKVATNAAIAGTKISPDFGSQNVTTSGVGNFKRPSDHGSAVGFYTVGATNLGQLDTHSSFEVTLTSNGYRDNTAGTNLWASYGANGENGAAQIALNPAGEIRFRTEASKNTGSNFNVTERMRITPDGDVAIGKTTPTSKLDVNGTVTATAFAGNASTATTLQTGRTISLTGDVTATTGSFNGSANATAAATIANNAVSNAKLRDSAALSVIGRSANSSGDPGDIAAATDGHVLRRSGTALGFGTLVNAGIASNAAIDGTKISPDFGSQEIKTSGAVSLGSSGFTSVVSGSADGVYIATSPSISISRDDNPTLFLRRRSGNGNVAVFYRDTTSVGSISVTTTATAYNTSSDYRLKQNVEPMVGGLAKLAALAPVTFEFKAEPNVKVDGFLAHEVQAVVPQAVTGEKDGEEMQGLDHSKLVPVLVAAVQELSAKVAALEGA